MASNRCEMFGLVVVVITITITLSSGVMATTECKNVVMSLSPCINYVCGNSSTPSYSCCSQLANIVKTQPRCLCALVTGGHSNTGFKINGTLAMGLPAACSIHTPPVSRCDGNVSHTTPVPVPASVPVPAESDGTIINLTFYLSFVSLIVASNMYAW